MSLAFTISRLAARILPGHRRAWGEAMAAEVAAIDNPRDAIVFAAGCLWAALSERITFMKAFVFAGRFGVGLVTVLYALSFLYFTSNGLGRDNPPPHLPFLLGWQVSTGLSHLAAAGFLVFWRPKPFLWACAAAAVPASALTIFGLTGMIMGKLAPGTMVISFAWPFVPIAMLMGAAWLFAWLEQTPKKPVYV